MIFKAIEPFFYIKNQPGLYDFFFIEEYKNGRLTFIIKGPRFSEKDCYYLQAKTDMLFHYLKLVV